MTELTALAQGIFQVQAPSVSWYVMLGLICLPGVVAVGATMASTLIWRHMNRAAGNPRLPSNRVFKVTLLAGALWGPLCQWTLQELASILTGVPVLPKLIIVAPFITGIAAVGTYEFLRWIARAKSKESEVWRGFYLWLSVKHLEGRDNTEVADDSDLTILNGKNSK